MDDIYIQKAQSDMLYGALTFPIFFQEALKHKQNGDYEYAFLITQLLITFQLPNDYRSKVHLLQAEIKMVLKEYEEAGRQALVSIHFEPNLRAAKLHHDSILMLQGPTCSLKGWWDFYTNIHEEKDRIFALKEIVIMLVKYKDLDEIIFQIMSPTPPKNQLEKLIVELSSTNHWLEMAYLIVGIFPDDSVFCGGAEDCSTNTISVVPLLKDYRINFKSWVDRLAAAIIKGGSPIEHLVDICNQPPLHTTAEIAVESGFFELYCLVAKMYTEWGRLDTKNRQGLSLIEYLKEKGYESTPHFQKILSINASLSVKSKDGAVTQEDFLVKKAKEAVEKKQYDKALEHYHKILESLDPNNNIERGRHFRNLSLVYSYKKDFEKSLEFADKSLSANPSFEKAYNRKVQVLKDLKRSHLACLVFLKGLPYSDDPVSFLSEAVKLFEINVDKFGKNDLKECLSLFQKVESSLWNQVLCLAAGRSQWTRISLIILGPSNQPLAKEFNASGVSLSTLYETLKKDDGLKKSCNLMLIELLKHRADIYTLSKDPAEVFPILVKVTLLIGSCTVLEYVLKRNPLRKTDLLLHTAVKNGDVKSDHCFKVVLTLLQKGMNPEATDFSGKVALEYIMSKFAITKALLRIYTEDLEMKSESLEKKGNEFFENNDYDLAFCYYTVAIGVLSQSNGNSDLSFRLRSRRCECYLELGGYFLAVDDASFILDLNSQSYKAHEIMSKVYRRNNPSKSYEHLYEAYRLLDWEAEDHVRQEIVVKLLHLTQKLDIGKISCLRIHDVFPACITLMETNEFTVAAYAFEIIVLDHLWPKDLDVSRIDVRHFCSDAAIRYGGVECFEQVIMFLLDNGADLRNLTVYKGDTYLHAAAILACRLGYITLLQYLVSRRVVRLCECNLVDKYGKNPLFRILNEPESVYKEQLIQIFSHIGNGIFQNLEMPEKTLPKDVYLRIDDGDIRNPPNKKVPNSTSAKKPSQKAPPPLAKSKVTGASQLSDACSYCQKLYNCAVKKQTSGADSGNVIGSLVELCQMNHEGKVHEELLQKSIDIIVDEFDNQSDIPTCLFSIKTDVFLKIVLRFASIKKWECMHICVKSYEQKKKSNVLEGFANKLTVADFLNSIVFKAQVETYSEILTWLIKNGATMGMDPNLKKTALEVCLTEGNYRAIIVLFKNGLDSSLLTLRPGDTPLHAAAEIALRKDAGYFELFEYLLELHDSDSVTYSHLDISRVDKQKQSMTHVACRIKCSKHSLRLLRICCERDVRSDLPDSSGKIPSEYISNNPNDERLRYLTPVSSESPSTSTNSSSELKCDAVALPEKSVTRMNSVKSEKKYSLRSVLKDLIDNMDDHKCKELHIVSFHKEDKKPVSKYRAEDVEDAEHLQDSSDGEEDEEGENDLLNDTMFDKLEWEVECTSDVWKTLHDRNMPYKNRKQAIYKIQLLAGGDWNRTLSKKVKNMPQTLKLFTLKLSRTANIVWELAVTFSPRCSDVMKSKDYTGVNFESLQGRVYTEVIRIWAVVFNLKDLKHVLDQIVKSHQRAESCHVKKQLESISGVPSGDATKRLPRLFAEKQIDKHQHDLQRYCPPVSDKDDEYHIIKFYSFSTALVSSVLQMETYQNVDFPFQVTELEHRIINLDSTAPIILLGRSGTGKTTCCVYRLWMTFVKYWTTATLADAPLYPSGFVRTREPEITCELPKPEDDAEDDEDDEETDESTTDNESNICEEEATANCSDCIDSPEYIHLHQLFITKNGVLCNEVRKNFHELRHGNEIAGKYHLQEDFDLPPTFQGVSDSHFPLFLTSKKLWVILDASLDPPYFFPRQKDLSLKHDIIGWSNEDDHLVFLPNIDDDDDEDEEERFTLPYESFGSQMKATNKKQEVTYEKFLQLWPEVNKPASGYHPSLVWTEIISFIKGSFEALHTEKGYLSEDEYIKIGKKRAPNFNGERNKVYQLFLRYLARKKQKQMFDESDVVFNLYKRLQKKDRTPCPLHEVYVDETQDFTQAELCLLIQLSEDPNRMFLTGDTAQSIMRGVSFRFSELQSLFYYAEKHAVSAKGSKTIHRPKSLYKLLHNYRSHQGILKMASSIIDILIRYFQDSFDPMEKDQGLFDGPKPKLLESCSLTDLSMMLRRDKQEMSHIEFGAHQVILVVNNESREKLPEELSTALVLTIFEAKGLEFDDVLLYNFFKDSQASKEWRIVTKFLDELVNKQKLDEEAVNQESIIQINWDVFQEANRPRPLDFNPDQHKILNSELKLLYTALTRARVNLWIFDTDVKKRAPMFDYLKSLDLVDTINTNLKDEDINELIFAEESTPEMWLKRGDDFTHKALYKIAAQCYNYGGHRQQEKLALANHHALTAQRCTDVQTKRENFLQAGRFYMESTQHIKAAKCLSFAKEKLLSAEIFEKCQEYESAGKAYFLLQKPAKAIECFEKLQQFDRTVQISHDLKMYDRAIDLVNQYDVLVESYVKRGESVPEVLIKHKPQKNLTYLCLQSADAYYGKGETDKMKSVLNNLKSDEKMEFLEKKGLISVAAEMVFDEGQSEKSVQLLRRNGHYEKSIELARRAGGDLLLASCLYTFAQHKYVALKNADEDTDVTALQREITLLLEEAKTCYQRTADMNGRSLCLLLLSYVNNDKDSAAEALARFLQISPHPNVAGGLQSASILVEYVQRKEIQDMSDIVKAIEMGYKLLKDLRYTASTVSLPLRECLEHFGFHILNNLTVCIYPKLQPLVSIQLEPMLSITDSSSQHPIKEIKQKLHQHLLNVIENLFVNVRMTYMLRLIRSIQCPFYLAGHECQVIDECFCPLRKIKLACKQPDSICLHSHEPYTFETFRNAIKITKLLMLMDYELIYQVNKEDIALTKQLQHMMNMDMYKIGKLLLKLLTPTAGNALPLKHLGQFRSLKKWFALFPKCGKYVRNYLFATWKSVRSRSRYLSDFFLESKILIGLFELNISVERWMKELCRPTGCITLNQGPGLLLFCDGFNICVYERFVESLFHLHERWDPLESLIKFTKYTGIIMRKAIVLPSLDILLFWCEFFVVLAMMLVLKNQNKMVSALPESYLIQSYFVDCLQPNSTFSLQTAIEKSRPLSFGKMQTLLNRIEKLVNLLCSQKVAQTAIKEQYVKTGVTERYVVLGLLLLCNSSRGVSKNLVPDILHALYSISISNIMVPRLQESLFKLSEVKGALDAVLILNELLQKRGDSLGQYRWCFDSQTRQGLQCCFLAPNATSSLNSLNFDSTSEKQMQDEEYYPDEDEDGFTESELSQARECTKKVDAVYIISRAYQAYRCRTLWRQLVFNVSNAIAKESGNQVDYFTDIKLSEVGCNICGFSFVSLSSLQPEIILEDALKEGEHSSQVEEYTEKKSEMEKHKILYSHKENEISFQLGVRKYRQEFVPILKKAQEILSSQEQENLNPEIEFYFERLNKSIKKLDEETRRMCKKACWKNFPSLHCVLKEVKAASENLDKKLSIKQIESANRERNEFAVLEDNRLEDFDDAQDIVQGPRSIRTKIFHKTRKQRH